MMGGSEVLLRDIINHLKGSFDVDVTVAVPFGENIVDPGFFGNQVRVTSFFKRKPTSRFGRWMFSHLYLVPRIVVNCVHPFWRYHAVISFSYVHLPLIPRAKVAWVHETLPPANPNGGFRRRVYDICMMRMLNRLDHVVFVSDAARDAFLLRYRCRNAMVLSNTIDVKKILTNAQLQPPLLVPVAGTNIISVGRLGRDKHFDRLIQVAEILRESNEIFHLWIVGDGPARDELERSVADSGLLAHVTFLGEQANPHCLMAQCDLYVCTSMTEGFGLAMLEAHVLGLPIVSGDNGGVRSIVVNPEDGIITENTVLAIAQGVKDVIRKGIRRGDHQAASFWMQQRVKYMQAVEKLLGLVE